MTSPLILAVDQGTGSTKVLVVDKAGAVKARGQAPVRQTTPHPGWVEQDPEEIWASVRRAVAEAVSPDIAPLIAAVGLSTQREVLSRLGSSNRCGSEPLAILAGSADRLDLR